jgi:hypothetical protein
MVSNGCDHIVIELRRKICTNGTPMYGHQCAECGRLQGDWLKSQAPVVLRSGELPAWDDQRSEQYWAERRARNRQISKDEVWDDRQKQREEERKAWWRDYSEYLKSPAWRSKRARVLRRANGYCEGCLIEDATEVHHLTYKHVKNEFCFELAALCQFCHERIHDEHKELSVGELQSFKPRIAQGG